MKKLNIKFDIKNRKLLGTIIGIIAFVILLIGATYALYKWSSGEEDKTNFNLTVTSQEIAPYIVYNPGTPILSSDNSVLQVGSNYTDGINSTIEFWKSGTTRSIFGQISLEVLQIGNNIKQTDTLKWALTTYNINNSTEVLLEEGTFNGRNKGDIFPIYTNFDLNNYQTFYKVYLWIDGDAIDNNKMISNEVISIEISSQASDTSGEIPTPTVIKAKQTLTSLELDSQINETVLTSFTNTSKNDNSTGIYASEDDLGTSYYFRGNITNNYVKFAGYYWRIIRINGDGSLRVIYDGTYAHANSNADSDRQIGTSAYNTNSNDNTYVGYMYGTAGSTTYEATHTNTNNSTIKTYIDNWYNTNIKNTPNANYVVDAIYCNDRTRVTDTTKMAELDTALGITSTGEGFGTKVTYYGSFNRMTSDITSVTPTLKCPETRDKFTVSNTLGNGKLDNPIGLITFDEMIFGGSYMYMGDTYQNNETYLYSGESWYWTMSPFAFYGGSARVGVGDLGAFNGYSVDGANGGARPVISLLSSGITGGNGTAGTPFLIGSE